MDSLRRGARPIAFVAGFLAVGLPYWPIPYREVGLPSTLITPALLVVGVAALVLRTYAAVPFGWAVGIAGAAVPAAVLARVVVETVGDPTSHNLWPFEIVLASGVGFGCALAGAIAGSLVARLFTRQTEAERR